MTKTSRGRKAKISTEQPLNPATSQEDTLGSETKTPTNATETETAATEQSNVPVDETHQQVIQQLRGECLEVEFTLHGLPKTRRITGTMADTIAGSVKGKRSGVRASWSLFTSKHPAVQNLNAAIRNLLDLRDSWTIVRSADAVRADDKVAIVGGVRLIPVADHAEFYRQFVARAKLVDEAAAKVQYAMDHTTSGVDSKNNPVDIPSIKAMDREAAGEAWDAKSYPENVADMVGVAKARLPGGELDLDEEGNPKYLITFSAYHVSEKLSGELQKRAYERLDAQLSSTVEAAMTYTTRELTDLMGTLVDELGNRVQVNPPPGSEFAYLSEFGDVEQIKLVTVDQDHRVPVGHVKVMLRYPSDKDGTKISRWFGPMLDSDYKEKFRPQATGTKKKIYPSVIEGIISQMQNFRDRKAKMLGQYGEKAIEAFAPLLASLTKYRSMDDTNAYAAERLANAIRSSDTVRTDLAKALNDTISRLDEEVDTVRKIVSRRRNIKLLDKERKPTEDTVDADSGRV